VAAAAAAGANVAGLLGGQAPAALASSLGAEGGAALAASLAQLPVAAGVLLYAVGSASHM
jgi:hypothetical protein